MPDLLSVKFKILTNKKLRQIILELVKSLNEEKEIEWTLNFTLNEKEKKEDKEFTEIISLAVFINPDLNAKAEETRKKGLNKKQSSQAIIAADFAKSLEAGEIEKESFDEQGEMVIAVR